MPLISQRPKPRVILGLMTFGPDTDAGARVTDHAEYVKTLDYLQSQGYNEVDTARAYVGGKQEAFTRDAKWKDRGLKLATKVYPTPPGNHKPEVLRSLFETSLKELGTDTVDIFYLHAADRSVPFAETLAEVDKLHKEGKFVELGLSNFTAFEVAEVVTTAVANNWVRPTIYQGMYNAITRSADAELIPALRRYGIQYVVYNPIGGGLFSGKYTTLDKSSIPEEGRFSNSGGRAGAMYRARYFKDATFEALRHIEPVVKAKGLTLLETALRWTNWHSGLVVGGVDYAGAAKGKYNKENDGKAYSEEQVATWTEKAKLQQTVDDGVIIGVSSLKQLEGNLADLEKGPLPEEVVKVLDEAWLINKATTPNYWHLDLKYTYDTQAALFGKK